MARIAATRALNDACIDYSAIQQVCVGYCYGDSTCGQRAVYQLGMTGVPVYNVNNNCATGSTALYMAKQFVEGGLSECCMALGAFPWQAAGLDCGCPLHPPDLMCHATLIAGFEKMEKGSLGAKYFDRTNPMDQHMELMMDLREFTSAPPTPQMFGNAAREHMEKFGMSWCLGSASPGSCRAGGSPQCVRHQAPPRLTSRRLRTRTTRTA